MKLYIVRHGESKHNAAHLHQGADSPLSKEGVSQTKFLAKRVSKLNDIDLMIVSPYLRTKQTAEEILKLKKHKVVFSDLAIEVKRPSIMLEKAWNDPEANRIKKLMDENRDNPNWHYSNEENFHDFKNRTIKLIKYIESFRDKNILLVGHGLLAKMMVGIMLFGENLTGTEHESIDDFFHTNNTGITLCEKNNEKWHLITWNDYAHLG